jgi:long-chain fatty acid transport protein
VNHYRANHRQGYTSRLAIASFAVLAVSPAYATDGYFDFGYGVKAKGIGGAGVAFAQDSIAPATNPAGIAFLEDRLDFGLTYFHPDRTASLGGTEYSGNGTSDFIIPEIGFKYGLSEKIDVALAVYGNGGMNTDYSAPLFDTPAPGTPSDAGIDLSQLFVAPTVSYKITEGHAVGISPILAYQRFKAEGLEEFGITNDDYDDSFGLGFRIGYTGKINEYLTIGATYQSRIYASEFDDYKGLFAEQGDFDIPSNFALGFAVHPNEKLTFAFDVERIFYSEVNSVGNNLSFARLANGLGSDEGPGFGWNDVTVIKTGIAYDVTEDLTLRVGYNYTTQPIEEDQTYFNILAPGVVQHHATAGLTWRFRENWELSAFYVHAFEETVKGSGNAFGPQTDADLSMNQDSFGLSLGWVF